MRKYQSLYDCIAEKKLSDETRIHQPKKKIARKKHKLTYKPSTGYKKRV